MTCTNCGTELKDGYKFCLKCGTPVSVSVVETEKEDSVTEADAENKALNDNITTSVQEALSDMDGLEEKLSKLHDLYTKELIDSDGYKKMKSKILGI